MICVQLNGGLGNQMFQYACGQALAYKHHTVLLLDTTQLKINNSSITFRRLELDIFKINIQEASKKDVEKLKPLFYRIVNVLSLRTGFRGIQTSKYFIEKSFSFNESIEKIGKDCYLNGYWQNSRYFQNIEPIIREEFKFPFIIDKVNNERLIRINKENSISLHVRRSDFVNNKHHKIHGACSIEYYRKAAEYISSKIELPFFFVFSDDIDWAQKNLNLRYPCEFVSCNIGKQNYIDMQLMSLCKHNIIANSSFSWWGAWLNMNPEKIVIAPKQWFVNETKNAQTNNLIPDTWIRL